MKREGGRRSASRFRFGIWDSERHYRDDLYWVRVLNAVHQRAREVDAELIDLPSPEDASDEASFDDVLLRLRSVGVDVILDWPFPETSAVTMLQAGIPIVHLSETSLHHPLLVAPQGLEAVAFDLVQRAAEMIGGRGTILVVGGGMQIAYSDDGASRLSGARRAAASLPDVTLLHVATLWDERAAEQVTRALRKDDRAIDAIVGFSDRVASLTRRCCIEAGRAVAEVPTFGINGTPDAIAEILAGAMAGTVEVLADDLGRQAIDMAVAVAGRTRYPSHFPYRTRYVDASSAAKVASRMLVDFGSVLRAPRSSVARERRVMDRFAAIITEVNQAFLSSRSAIDAWQSMSSSLQATFDADRVVVAWPERVNVLHRWVVIASDEPVFKTTQPDEHWVEVLNSVSPKVGVRRDAASLTIVPFGVSLRAFGCVELVHSDERIMTMTEMDTLRDLVDHVASLAALRGWEQPHAGPEFHSERESEERRVTLWIESAADGAALIREFKAAMGDGAIAVRRLPVSRRATWRWVTGSARHKEIDVMLVARWTPDVSDWISRWREERLEGQGLLVLSEVPWPVEALRALPHDVPCVIHSVVTLPPQEATAWVSVRLRDSAVRHGLREHGRVRDTVAHLHAGFEGSIRRERLASEVATGADRLTRTFREVMGVTPRTYLSRLRVHHAMRLLLTTDLSLTEIGARVGWHDPAQFSSSFKRVVGRSPRAFRSEEPSMWA
jgi:AraC-like DNA-binding protein/ABC-type sugar transport system substrate-binding protein